MSQVSEHYGRSGRSEEISNYLAPAILALFCCFPLGIIPLIYALQVNGRIDRGDLAGARHASNWAKVWSVSLIGVGVIVFLVVIIVSLFYFSWAVQQGS